MVAVMIGIDPAQRSRAMGLLCPDEEQLAALEVVLPVLDLGEGPSHDPAKP